MVQVVYHVRRVGLTAVALLSVAMGVGAIWVFATPEVIGRTPTWILFGVVGLLTLPPAVVGALVMDRKAAAAEAPVVGDEPREVVFLDGGVRTAADQAPRAVTLANATWRPALAHAGASAHDRSAAHRRHRSGVASQE